MASQQGTTIAGEEGTIKRQLTHPENTSSPSRLEERKDSLTKAGFDCSVEEGAGAHARQSLASPFADLLDTLINFPRLSPEYELWSYRTEGVTEQPKFGERSSQQAVLSASTIPQFHLRTRYHRHFLQLAAR